MTANSNSKNTTKKHQSDYVDPFALFFIHHFQAFWISLRRLGHAPFSTFLTIAVIGVSLALPSALFMLLQEVEHTTQKWNDSAQISLFLKVGTANADVKRLLDRLHNSVAIAKVNYISPQRGLVQFQKTIGLEKVLANMPNNPLPPVIEITPSTKIQSSQQLDRLVNSLKQLPYVQVAQLNLQWLQKLFTFVDIIQRGILVISLLLGVGVLLVVGNTIRLFTENYRSEIEVVKLMGASDAFTRRPFLYTGVFYGLFGAMLALLLDDLAILWLREPVARLAILYNNSFQLQILSHNTVAGLLVSGAVLGLMGAWIAVARHLGEINPC